MTEPTLLESESGREKTHWHDAQSGIGDTRTGRRDLLDIGLHVELDALGLQVLR
jgi:hypothetical protein